VTQIATYQLQFREAFVSYLSALPKQPAALYDPIRYTLEAEGKRMRPLLVLLGAGLFNENISSAIPAAIGIELFHNFTLLHDDIMDNAALRRGHATVYKKWNTNIAILSGDAMFTESFKQISLSPTEKLPEILSVFNRTATEVCEGQQWDMDFETASNVSINQYLQMIELKTAVLLGASLQIGALCNGAAKTESEKLYEFGKQAGIAFQLQDDILDVYGNAEKFGKTVGGDIVANKKTFLLLKALELANRYQKEELQNWMQAGEKDAAAKVNAVKSIYDQLHIRELAEEEMQKHYEAGIHALQSVKSDETKKDALKGFADALMVREY
jgi:geranylgeranyl diphosphate synthase, type II